MARQRALLGEYGRVKAARVEARRARIISSADAQAEARRAALIAKEQAAERHLAERQEVRALLRAREREGVCAVA
jgi:vacuolar-type H+-ATPase subunit E/Vma4